MFVKSVLIMGAIARVGRGQPEGWPLSLRSSHCGGRREGDYN